MSSFVKDPDAVLDYRIDWSQWLQEGEAIVTSTWEVPVDLAAGLPASHTSTDATVWLAGGTAWSKHLVVNHITTTAGREDDRTLVIRVTER